MSVEQHVLGVDSGIYHLPSQRKSTVNMSMGDSIPALRYQLTLKFIFLQQTAIGVIPRRRAGIVNRNFSRYRICSAGFDFPFTGAAALLTQ